MPILSEMITSCIDIHRFLMLAAAALFSFGFFPAESAHCEFKPLFQSATEFQEPGSTGHSAPAIGELDNDPSNGSEMAVGQRDGSVVAISNTGAKLWRTYLPSSQCAVRNNLNKLYSSPTIADLNGDGRNEVVIGYGTIGGRGCDGGVAALDGAGGQIIWFFSLKNLSKKQKFWAIWHGVFGKPAVADTNGDGKMEIGFGSYDRNVYLLNYDGSVRWYYQAADTVWSSPVFADINSDGILEMLIGTDIFGNKKLKPITKSGGYLYAFKTFQNPKLLYGFRNKKAYYWVRYFDQVVYSTPRVAEMLAENKGMEVAIGSGCFYPERNRNKNGKFISILSLRTGQILRKLPTINCFSSAVATQDINGDGEAEVFATVENSTTYAGDSKGRLIAYDVQRSARLWEIIPTYNGRADQYLGAFKSPVVADIDQNGSYEVYVNVNDGVAAYSAGDGSEISCHMRNCKSTGEPLAKTTSYLFSTPVIADFDRDGISEIFIGGRKDSSSGIYGWQF